MLMSRMDPTNFVCNLFVYTPKALGLLFVFPRVYSYFVFYVVDFLRKNKVEWLERGRGFGRTWGRERIPSKCILKF